MLRGRGAGRQQKREATRSRLTDTCAGSASRRSCSWKLISGRPWPPLGRKNSNQIAVRAAIAGTTMRTHALRNHQGELQVNAVPVPNDVLIATPRLKGEAHGLATPCGPV